MPTKKNDAWFDEMLKQERTTAEIAGRAVAMGRLVDKKTPAARPSVGFDNWKAITYARTYCGQQNNACGVFLNVGNQSDCAHFIAHCLHAGGIDIKPSDPANKLCPSGLAVRNTDLVAALKDAVKKYANVQELGLIDAIVGDVGFLSNLLRPSHAFMLCEPANLADPRKPAKVYSHTANRCCEDNGAEIRQWFATMFRITDA